MNRREGGLKNNRVSISGSDEITVMALIGHIQVPVPLDSGAQITVLPLEVVLQAAKLEEN